MDRFVVGSGRCGSTLLSRMLAQHRQVVSLFEVFNGLDVARRFDPTPVAGAAIGALLAAEQPFVTAVLRRGYPVAEIVYPFGPDARYRRDAPLPWVLVATLPRLSTEPDAWFDALVGFLAARDAAPPAEHYRALFAWLTQRAGGVHWIERSGSSIDYVADLHRTFPEARFVHLHRDGCEVALSMREHHAYRLPISLLYGAPLETGETIADLGPLDLGAEPTPADPISRILASTPKADAFGRYWTDQITRGIAARQEIARERWLDVRFEDLVTAPRDTLERIATFFELETDPGFQTRGASLVRGVPSLRFPELARDEQHSLSEACLPGQLLIGR